MKRQILEQEQDGQSLYLVIEDRWEDGDVREVFKCQSHGEAVEYIKAQEALSDYAAFCSENDW